MQAHIGIYCGVSAARLARPDARVVVTEHASFLDRVFAERAALDLYEEMLERADEVHCVSTAVRDQLTTQFPRHAAKVRIVPNVIDFDRFTARPQPVTDLLRWLYIGRFMELKRVPLVLDAFAEIAREEPRATLTLVGSGPVESALRQRIAELGLDGRVEIRPPVAPDDVVRLMHEHDLLVHASRIETFGLTVVEAVAAELPVLVARSSGPAETLAGLEGVAGSLVDLADDDAPALASAYRQLRAARAALDLPRARKELLARYGREAVGRQLIDAYRAEPAARPARAVVIALDGPAPTVKFDGRVDVFTSSPTAVGPGVHVVKPGPPRFVKAFAQRAPSTATEAFLNVADRAVEKIWRRLPGRRTARVTPEQAWSVIEPAITWPSVDRVLVTGPRSATVGRYLAEAYPEVVVSTSTEDMCSPRT